LEDLGVNGRIILKCIWKIGIDGVDWISLCTFEEIKGIGWCKMGIWRLKGMRGNIDKGV
jgi:hypothetical protein